VKLDWAILSNAGEIRENLAYVLGGGWDTAWRPSFPAPFLGTLNLRLLLHRTEVAQRHTIQLEFQDQDGRPFAQRLDLNVGPGQVPQGYEVGWDIPAMVAINLGLTVPKAGRYSIEILVDGQHAKTMAFKFLQGGPPGAPPAAAPPQGQT
jgi:hypothetical protein